MNEAIGPTYKLTETEVSIGNPNYVQENLPIIGLDTSPSYALLGYNPTKARSVNIFVNGLFKLQGVDYIIDERKISFTGGINTGSIVQASYPTIDEVASIPEVEISSDLFGKNVRMSQSGMLQIFVEDPLNQGTFNWYDMSPEVDPVSGAISFVPSQEKSINQ